MEEINVCYTNIFLAFFFFCGVFLSGFRLFSPSLNGLLSVEIDLVILIFFIILSLFILRIYNFYYSLSLYFCTF